LVSVGLAVRFELLRDSILHKKSEICVEFAVYFVLPYTLVYIMFAAMYVIAVSKERVYNWRGDVFFVPYCSNGTVFKTVLSKRPLPLVIKTASYLNFICIPVQIPMCGCKVLCFYFL